MNDNFIEMNGYEIVISEYEAPEIIQYRACRKYFYILPQLSSLSNNIKVMDELCQGLKKSHNTKFGY